MFHFPTLPAYVIHCLFSQGGIGVSRCVRCSTGPLRSRSRPSEMLTVDYSSGLCSVVSRAEHRRPILQVQRQQTRFAGHLFIVFLVLCPFLARAAPVVA